MAEESATVDMDAMPELVVVTGMSGAGRTEAMHVFEDLGYFSVDNLPANLIVELVDMRSAGTGGPKRLAVVCDARNGDYFGSLTEAIGELRERGIDLKVIFLDADDEKLVARYKSSRRRHPLCTDGTTIAQGIQRERNLLMDLRDMSDEVIDTTDMLPSTLRNTIRQLFAKGDERRGLAVTVYSFGFKHGAPVDADVVMDVRFLPNPYYDSELRPLTGLDAPVRDFVMLRDETIEFKKRWHSLLAGHMPGSVAAGTLPRANGFGCSGGQHRSVALAESTGDYLKSKGYRVSVAHRDLKLAERGAGSDFSTETPDIHGDAAADAR